MAAPNLDDTLLKILIGRATKKTRCMPDLDVDDVIEIIKEVKDILKEEKILIRAEGNFTIVGDLHGNIDDLIRILETRGYPPATSYIFLGDYVDRGSHSIEVILLLFILKIKFPDNVRLIRGNHESPSMTSNYGFKADCKRYLSKKCYYAFLSAFQQLPISCILNKKILCVHGGISPSISKVEDILNEQKPFAIPYEGPVTDILWSDPVASVPDFVQSDRLVGFLFGSKPLIDFLDANKLQMLVRSHEDCQDGYVYPFSDAKHHSKRCLTIFSASNYCDESNKSAILVVSEECEYKLIQFEPFSPSLAEKHRAILPEWLMKNGEITVSAMEPEKLIGPEDLFAVYA